MSDERQQRGPDQPADGPTRWLSAEPARRDVGGEPARRDVGGAARRRDVGSEPDVLLDVPEVSVDSIRLAVEGLDADLSLRARLANLLQLDAGVRVHLQKVELDITGVHAEALLKVRLEKVGGDPRPGAEHHRSQPADPRCPVADHHHFDRRREPRRAAGPPAR